MFKTNWLLRLICLLLVTNSVLKKDKLAIFDIFLFKFSKQAHGFAFTY